ncbi:DEAD/DEAH box helicase family protein [Nocardia otitidiscaviarum]|uniref:DEAD/DEAH box helicase family protein n=1 Tax=Nocardia otitidiscaviarum TaxID=1823 RepID=UPI001894492A|nr:DEAD/DEAH box helicase family protein [Nocardia otitidiscaviarum]MBF6133500.1 DEAD/DEAH box helicase family protein [Nocardia otitidiscaviarum]
MTKSGTAPGTDRPLSEVARYVIAPTGITSTGWPSIRDTCRRLGWGFDRWQDGAGRLILAKRTDGLYAADTVVISIPRQVGKTYLIGCIIFALCLRYPRLTVIWTAHRKTTAAETFETFDAMAQRPRVAPHIRQVLRGKGDEKIIFNNRSRILFGARESGFGRGFSDVDVLVFDEAQIMTAATLEDMAAAQNVARNPLTFMMGTPPRPKDPGEAFTLMREEALDGDADGTLYIELSADRGCDPMDREQWRKANPSFPHRTSERAMLRLRKKLKNLDSWLREALGIWDEISKHKAVVKEPVWSALADVGPADGTKPDALGVDMSHARAISISACWLEDEHAHAEEVWAGIDEDAAIEWIVARARRRIPVVIDNASPAASLAPRLRARKVRVITTSAPDMAKACGGWLGKVLAGRFTHGDQQAVNDAVKGARKRAIGTAGGWGWDRADETVNIAPIVGMTLALFGATATQKKASGGRGSRSSTGRRAVTI